MTFIPALDTFRALAIVLVMLFHFGLAGFGWCGVSLFFVLSGYLITSILVETRALPASAFFRRFYIRRALRIFPLYYAYVLLVALSKWMFGVPERTGHAWLGLMTYTFNFVKVHTAYDYSDVINHLWSLCVEEQFYLLWPTLVFLTPPRVLSSLSIALIGISPLLRWIIADPFAVYNLPFSHLEAFAIGALIATGRFRPRRPLFWLALSMALSLALGALNFILADWEGTPLPLLSFGYPLHMAYNYQYIWGYTLIHLDAALAIVFILDASPSLPLLRWAPGRYIGKISYGLYIYHVPLIVVLQHAVALRPSVLDSLLVLPLLLVVWGGASIAIAHLSYRYFERPFLQLKDRWAR